MSENLVGYREYARHREAKGLHGATLRAVQKAIETGRIETIIDANGKKRINVEAADAQWERNTDHEQSFRANSAPHRRAKATRAGAEKRPTADTDSGQYWAARTRREMAEAAKAELQLAEMEKSLVSRASVGRASFEAGRLLRDMVLSVSSIVAAELVAMTDPHEIEMRIRTELRRVLDKFVTMACNEHD